MHRIHLRGFWTAAPQPGGGIVHRRSFGRPRTLDTDERAWLVFESFPVPPTVYLNGTNLGTANEFDVTELLQMRNAIEIHGEIGEVAMEIRRDEQSEPEA